MAGYLISTHLGGQPTQVELSNVELGWNYRMVNASNGFIYGDFSTEMKPTSNFLVLLGMCTTIYGEKILLSQTLPPWGDMPGDVSFKGREWIEGHRTVFMCGGMWSYRKKLSRFRDLLAKVSGGLVQE